MKSLSLVELEKIAGGTPEEAMEYLYDLHRKYGGKSVLDVLAKATDEEVEHLIYLKNH